MNTSEEKEDLMQQFGDQIPFGSPSEVERYICGIVTDDDLANAWVDEFGVKYSSDHLRLLKAPADLETYVIKEGCKIICVRAFEGCTGLTSIEIPGGVTEIGTGAFSGCSSLESITLPFVGDKPHTATDTYQYPFGYIFGTDSYMGGTSTGQSYYGSSTSEATGTTYCIPSSLKSVKITGSSHIPRGAFYGCTGLASIEIPSIVTSIGYQAFYGCYDLTCIEIPSGVTSIGGFAFSGCRGLTSIEIPDSVTGIGVGAFWSCTGLTSIAVALGNRVYDSRNNCNAIIETATNTLVAGCQNTIIPSSVTSIGKWAFYGCTGLTSIEIPSSVTSIGYSAFLCVKNVIYTGGATGSPWKALAVNGFVDEGFVFTDAEKTQLAAYIGKESKVVIPSGVTSIGYWAFSGCTGLTNIEIPSGVTSIGDRAFKDCTGLTSVEIPSGVTSIGDEAFSGCSELTSIDIPDSVTGIGDYAFSGTAWYKNQPDGLVYVGKVAYKYKGTMPDNANIVLADGTLEIAGNAFSGCTGLTSIEIPSGVTSIGDYAFYGCTGLTSIEIPSSVTSIGYKAFYGCYDLTSIEIPSSVTSIGNYAFYDCTGLTSIEIPSSVTSIGSNAFNGCTGLTSIEIPDSVTSIDYWAFDDCTSLAAIYIPKGSREKFEKLLSGYKAKLVER